MLPKLPFQAHFSLGALARLCAPALLTFPGRSFSVVGLTVPWRVFGSPPGCPHEMPAAQPQGHDHERCLHASPSVPWGMNHPSLRTTELMETGRAVSCDREETGDSGQPSEGLG